MSVAHALLRAGCPLGRALVPTRWAAAKRREARNGSANRKSRRGTHECVRHKSGQALSEFAVLYAGVILPLTFMIVFASEMLWVWHSVVDFTRDGARYAATHCWMADGSNVAGPGGYMPTHVPPMIDMDQFQTGSAGIQVQYWQADLTTGALTPFSCGTGDCSAACVPDQVTVSITNYQFTRFSGFFKLPAVTIPPFTTSVPIESAGCDESGNCLP